MDRNIYINIDLLISYVLAPSTRAHMPSPVAGPTSTPEIIWDREYGLEGIG
jgi:hypothetical protein